MAACAGGLWFVSQTLTAQDSATFKSTVDLVVLSFTVLDGRGHYVSGIKPENLRITEDGIPQKISTFAEGNQAPMQILPDGDTRTIPGETQNGFGLFPGTSVFLLFDTSNMMYNSFVYAEDAIANFIRGVDKNDAVAVYSFSRNMVRQASLTRNRLSVLDGLRNTVAGDDTALYDGLLLTTRDAARTPGRKVIIVFSNGPDNSSVVGPDAVGAVAQDAGIPIYVISTAELNSDSISGNAFRRITALTGGKAYWARTWQKQVDAFDRIREDLDNSYTVTYYPAPNPNEGFRKIDVEIPSDVGKKLRVRARPGYHPRSS